MTPLNELKKFHIHLLTNECWLILVNKLRHKDMYIYFFLLFALVVFYVTFKNTENCSVIIYVCYQSHRQRPHMKHAYVLTLIHPLTNDIHVVLYCWWCFVIFLCTLHPFLHTSNRINHSQVLLSIPSLLFCTRVCWWTDLFYIEVLFIQEIEVDWMGQLCKCMGTFWTRTVSSRLTCIFTICVIICTECEMSFRANVSRCMQQITNKVLLETRRVHDIYLSTCHL